MKCNRRFGHNFVRRGDAFIVGGDLCVVLSVDSVVLWKDRGRRPGKRYWVCHSDHNCNIADSPVDDFMDMARNSIYLGRHENWANKIDRHIRRRK